MRWPVGFFDYWEIHISLTRPSSMQTWSVPLHDTPHWSLHGQQLVTHAIVWCRISSKGTYYDWMLVAVYIPDWCLFWILPLVLLGHLIEVRKNYEGIIVLTVIRKFWSEGWCISPLSRWHIVWIYETQTDLNQISYPFLIIHGVIRSDKNNTKDWEGSCRVYISVN